MRLLTFFSIIIPIIVIIISVKRGNSLISKTDAPRVFKQTKISLVFITLVWIVILLYAQFSLYPTLDKIYESLNYNNPFSPSLASYFTYLAIIALIVFTVYTFTSNSIKKEFEENLSKYNKEDTIKLKDLVSKKLEKIMILMMTLPASIIFIFGILSGFYVAWLASNYLNTSTQETSPQNQTTNPSLTPTPDPTANWKTYTEINTRFTLKYPNHWNQLDLANNSSIYLTNVVLSPQAFVAETVSPFKEFPEVPNGLHIAVFNIRDCTNSADYAQEKINEYLSLKDSLYPDLEIESLKLDKINGYIIYKGAPGVEAQKGPNLFVFQCPREIQISFDPTDIENSEQFFDQILSTFRFLPSDKTECEAAGGRWGRFGLADSEYSEYCDFPPWDQ